MLPTHTQDKILLVYCLYCMTLHFSLSCPKNVFFTWISNKIHPMAKAVLCLISTMWLYNFWECLISAKQEHNFTNCMSVGRMFGVWALSPTQNFTLTCSLSSFFFYKSKKQFHFGLKHTLFFLMYIVVVFSLLLLRRMLMNPQKVELN